MSNSKCESGVFACNLHAIADQDRPRYHSLVRQLKGAVAGCSETLQGYRFEVDGAKMTVEELEEWIRSERLCCPFLNLNVSSIGSNRNSLLEVGGASGVKELIREVLL